MTNRDRCRHPQHLRHLRRDPPGLPPISPALVIGYSGGKDSTTVLQLIWKALEQLQAEQRQKPVYVIASDTKVETPVIVDFIDATLRQINERAAATGMPFSAQKVMPTLDDSFWVNLIGRGYPAPTTRFPLVYGADEDRPGQPFHPAEGDAAR